MRSVKGSSLHTGCLLPLLWGRPGCEQAWRSKDLLLLQPQVLLIHLRLHGETRWCHYATWLWDVSAGCVQGGEECGNVRSKQRFCPLLWNDFSVMSVTVTSGKPCPLLGKQKRCHGLAYPGFTTCCCKLYKRMCEGKVQKAWVHVVRWCEFTMRTSIFILPDNLILRFKRLFVFSKTYKDLLNKNLTPRFIFRPVRSENKIVGPSWMFFFKVWILGSS